MTTWVVVGVVAGVGALLVTASGVARWSPGRPVSFWSVWSPSWPMSGRVAYLALVVVSVTSIAQVSVVLPFIGFAAVLISWVGLMLAGGWLIVFLHNARVARRLSPATRR